MRQQSWLPAACCLPHDGFVNGQRQMKPRDGDGDKAATAFTCAKLDFLSTLRLSSGLSLHFVSLPLPPWFLKRLLVSALKSRDEQMTKAMAAQWAHKTSKANASRLAAPASASASARASILNSLAWCKGSLCLAPCPVSCWHCDSRWMALAK